MSFRSCNFGELLKVVVLTLETSDALWWCIPQTNPGFFLLPGQVVDFISDPVGITNSWSRWKRLTGLLDG